MYLPPMPPDIASLRIAGRPMEIRQRTPFMQRKTTPAFVSAALSLAAVIMLILAVIL